MISQMRFSSITVTDIESAKDFYVNKLGFHLVVENPLPGGNKFVMVVPSKGGSSLVFTLPFPNQEHLPSRGISFLTDDFNKTYEELSSKGVKFTKLPFKAPWGGMEAVFVDPSGNALMIQEDGI